MQNSAQVCGKCGTFGISDGRFFSSATHTRFYRSTLAYPARAVGTAAHAFLDAVNLGETACLQQRLYLRGAVAGATNDADRGVEITVNLLKHRVDKALHTPRMQQLNPRRPLLDAGLTPFFRSTDINQREFARLNHTMCFR